MVNDEVVEAMDYVKAMLAERATGTPTQAEQKRIIQQLQEHANQARFVNGERMLEYPNLA